MQAATAHEWMNDCLISFELIKWISTNKRYKPEIGTHMHPPTKRIDHQELKYKITEQKFTRYIRLLYVIR